MTGSHRVHDPVYDLVVFDEPLSPRARLEDHPRALEGDPRSGRFPGAVSALTRNNWGEILRSREFQRMHFLRQMGVAWLAFPSASQTRFGHSVGVYALGELALARARIKLGEDADGGPLWKWAHSLDVDEEFLAALLLHDVGHFPYSHLLEPLFPEISHEELGAAVILLDLLDPGVRIRQAHKRALSETQPHDGTETRHESNGVLLSQRLAGGFRGFSRWVVAWLMASGHMKGDWTGLSDDRILRGVAADRKAGLHRASIEDLKVLRCMVSGLLDLDRFDHYQRDSFFSGVKIGTFNFRSFINGVTLRVPARGSDPIIELTAEAAAQAVSMLEARQNITRAVFNSPDALAYSLMFRWAATAHVAVAARFSPAGDDERLRWLFLTDDELLYEIKRSPSDAARYVLDLVITGRPYRSVGHAAARLNADIGTPGDLDAAIAKIARETIEFEGPHGAPVLLWEPARAVSDSAIDPGGQWLDLTRVKVDGVEFSNSDRETYEYLARVRRGGRREVRFFLHPLAGNRLPTEFLRRCEAILAF